MCNELFFASCSCILEISLWFEMYDYLLISGNAMICGGLVVGMIGNLKKYFISLEFIFFKLKLVFFLGVFLNMLFLMICIYLVFKLIDYIV